MTMDASAEIAQGDRFGFGRNWQQYSVHIDEMAIAESIGDISSKLGQTDLAGKVFLDIGSGSGLSSLAANRMGARVISFDFDPDAVECTRQVRDQFAPDSGDAWQVICGSVLDKEFLSRLPSADVVYSWGVLHHTGSMWEAMGNAASLVPPGGRLFVALYNDQGPASKIWMRVKRRYNSSGDVGKAILLRGSQAYLKARTLLIGVGMLVGLGSLSGVLAAREEHRSKPRRGMRGDNDLVDWVGGWPFEVCTPAEVFDFLTAHGFTLTALQTCGGNLGCNVFVAQRQGLRPDVA